jgi:DNA-binding MarR family transcriptional regulator
MHAIFFSMKRTFQRVLAVTRRPLANHGLTAARFDMLYALSAPMPQRTLQRTLGVSAPTVSRMLKSLESLGLVARGKGHDARARIVHLTLEGFERLAGALHEIVDRGAAQLVVDSAFPRTFLGSDSLEEVYELDLTLLRARCRLGDCAALFYPWHPDD